MVYRSSGISRFGSLLGRASGSILVLFAVLIFCGWIPRSGFFAIVTADTAVLFLLAGVAVLTHRSPDSVVRSFSTASIATLFVLSNLFVVYQLFDRGLGVNQALETLFGSSPGVSADFLTMVGILLFSFGMVFSRLRLFFLVHATALVVGGLAAFDVTVHLLEPSLALGDGQLSGPVALLVLAVGLFSAGRPNRWFAMLTSEFYGGPLLRALMPLAVVWPVVSALLVGALLQRQVFEPSLGLAAMAGALVIGLVPFSAFVAARLNTQHRRLNATRASLELALQRFEVVLQDSPVVCFNQDRELRYTWVYNPIIEFEKEIGRTDLDLLDPGAERDRLVAAKNRVIETGASVRDTFLILQHGRQSYYDTMLTPLRDRRGDIIGITGAAMDVTEREEQEDAYRRLRNRLEFAQEAAKLGTFELDLQTGKLLWSRALVDLYGGAVPRDESDWIRLVAAEDQDRLSAALARARHSGELQDICCKVIRGGDTRWLEIRGRVIRRPETQGGDILTGVNIDITAFAEAERTARDLEERFRAFLDSGVVGMAFGSVTGQINFANAEYLRIVGRGQETLSEGRLRWDEITPKEWLPVDFEHLEEAKSSGSCSPYEKEYLRPDGSRVPILIGFTLVHHRTQFVAFVLDISERKQAASELEEGRRRLRQALNAGQVVAFEWDPVTDLIVREGEAAELFGGEGKQRGAAFLDSLHPDDRASMQARMTGVSPDDPTYQAEFRVVGQNGQLHWFRETAQGEFDREGRLVKIRGLAQDISERKRTEDALRERELQFHVLAEGMPQMVWTTNQRGESDYVSRRFSEYIGEEISLWLQSVHPDDRAPAEREWRRSLESAVPLEVQTRLRSADGSYRWFLVRALPLKDDHGAVRNWFGTCTDINEQREATERLRDNEERLKLLSERLSLALSSTGTGIWEWDLARDLVHSSGQCTAYLTGQDRVRVMPLEEFISYLHRDDQAMFSQAIQQGRETAQLPLLEVRVLREGQVRWLEIFGRFVSAEKSAAHWAIGTVREITDRKQAEEERKALLDSERAARAEVERSSRLKDEFVATLSHELRTPLNSILGWAQMLSRSKAPSAEQTGKGLEVIERNAKQQSRMIEDLLDLSRILSGKLKLKVEVLEPGFVISSALESLRHAAEARGISISSDIHAAQALVRGDETRLQQIMWNLLSNAIKFTPNGGRVDVSVRVIETDVIITVKDTGIGIEPDFVPHLFNRFSQADSGIGRQHRGLGLGLSIVRHLVELHGGKVEAQSEGLNKGSTFVVSLPRFVPREETASRERLLAARTHPDITVDLMGKRILVVEDEPDARELVKRILEEYGADVQAASCANEALTLLPEFRPDVVVSDISMPTVDGYQLMRSLREQGISVPALALTAFARPEDREKALRSGYQAHITKPFDPGELLKVVSELGDTRPHDPLTVQ